MTNIIVEHIDGGLTTWEGDLRTGAWGDTLSNVNLENMLLRARVDADAAQRRARSLRAALAHRAAQGRTQ